MGSTLTVRRIRPGDKAWLRREAHRAGISMEEFVRRLIREERERSPGRVKPSEAFRRHFGPEHGVELPATRGYGYRTVQFRDGE